MNYSEQRRKHSKRRRRKHSRRRRLVPLIPPEPLEPPPQKTDYLVFIGFIVNIIIAIIVVNMFNTQIEKKISLYVVGLLYSIIAFPYIYYKILNDPIYDNYPYLKSSQIPLKIFQILIALPIFYLLYKIVRKQQLSKNDELILFFLGGIISVPMFAFVIALGSSMGHGGFMMGSL